MSIASSQIVQLIESP